MRTRRGDPYQTSDDLLVEYVPEGAVTGAPGRASDSTAWTGPNAVAHAVASLDPYMRGRMSDAPSYAKPVGIGEVMVGGAVSEVVASNVPRFAKGDLVVGRTGGLSGDLVCEAMMMRTEGASYGDRERPTGPTTGRPRSEGRPKATVSEYRQYASECLRWVQRPRRKTTAKLLPD